MKDISHPKGMSSAKNIEIETHKHTLLHTPTEPIVIKHKTSRERETDNHKSFQKGRAEGKFLHMNKS